MLCWIVKPKTPRIGDDHSAKGVTRRVCAIQNPVSNIKSVSLTVSTMNNQRIIDELINCKQTEFDILKQYVNMLPNQCDKYPLTSRWHIDESINQTDSQNVYIDVTNNFPKISNMLGVFANRDIEKDALICHYMGALLTHTEYEASKREHYIGSYTAVELYKQCDERDAIYLIGAPHLFGALINDPRNANSLTKLNAKFSVNFLGVRESLSNGMYPIQSMRVVALKPINKGDEILLSYGSGFWKNFQRSCFMCARTSKKDELIKCTGANGRCNRSCHISCDENYIGSSYMCSICRDTNLTCSPRRNLGHRGLELVRRSQWDIDILALFNSSPTAPRGIRPATDITNSDRVFNYQSAATNRVLGKRKYPEIYPPSISFAARPRPNINASVLGQLDISTSSTASNTSSTTSHHSRMPIDIASRPASTASMTLTPSTTSNRSMTSISADSSKTRPRRIRRKRDPWNNAEQSKCIMYQHDHHEVISILKTNEYRKLRQKYFQSTSSKCIDKSAPIDESLWSHNDAIYADLGYFWNDFYYIINCCADLSKTERVAILQPAVGLNSTIMIASDVYRARVTAHANGSVKFSEFIIKQIRSIMPTIAESAEGQRLSSQQWKQLWDHRKLHNFDGVEICRECFCSVYAIDKSYYYRQNTLLQQNITMPVHGNALKISNTFTKQDMVSECFAQIIAEEGEALPDKNMVELRMTQK
jgi:hypothetical protein